MFTTTVLFALLALDSINSSPVWADAVEGSDNCLFNCFMGVRRVTDDTVVVDFTPCSSEGVCLNAKCVDESDVRACLKKLKNYQSLVSFERKGCEITCRDDNGGVTNATRGDYKYCEFPETEDSDEFTSEYGYCLDGICRKFETPEPYSGEDGQSGENSQGQSGEDSRPQFDSYEE